MIDKVIDGLNEMAYTFIKAVAVILGVYSCYELLFNLDIPPAFSFMIILAIFIISFMATAEEKKHNAIPVVMVPGGKPTMPKIGGTE